MIAPAPLHAATSVREVLERMDRDAGSAARPIDVALLHAARVDRLGFAFAAGYLAATRTLGALVSLPLEPGARVSLAASETTGAHPRSIHTSFEAGRLRGKKVWTTLGREATHLLVIARAGEERGRPALKAILVPVGRPGVSLEDMPETPFCPEIRHAAVTLQDVEVQARDVAPGDAFVRILKPFRTIEDLCVQAALVAWIGAMSRRLELDRTISGRAAALALAVRELASMPPDSAVTHVTLGGLLDESAALLMAFQASLERAPAEHRERFERDRALLTIAERVRNARLEKAWAAMGY